MLADSLLPIQFWAEAVNTACYVLNRVLVTKPQLKTPYELLMGRSPNISFMRPFGCPLTILNTLDHLEQGISCDDVEDKDDQQFIVHTTQSMPPEERTAAKEVTLSSEDQALHDELVSLMHQESLAKDHNDDQRIAFEEEKRRISIAKGKEHVDSTFNLSTANTPPQSTGNTPTDSDDVTQQGVFSLQTLLMLRKAENKRDERGTIIKNKARLVAQGYRQEEGVDYDEANITEECSQQPPGFEDPAHPNRSYSLKALYSLQQPKTWSMIGWLCTYCSRPDLMFAVCTVCKISSPPKVSHLHAVKRIFRYLKHQPNLGLWYPKDSPFHLEAFSDSDYAGDNHDRRSNQRMSKSWQKLVSLAMHETNNCAISTTKQNMYSCSFVLSFVGCKINTDFWI
ncbi:retrovirus-related pol polyprotein from transposon TNT 1-94 [Tanacetum coccineum]